MCVFGKPGYHRGLLLFINASNEKVTPKCDLNHSKTNLSKSMLWPTVHTTVYAHLTQDYTGFYRIEKVSAILWTRTNTVECGSLWAVQAWANTQENPCRSAADIPHCTHTTIL